MPWAPRVGRAVLATGAGAWVLGPGLGVIAAVAGAAVATAALRSGRLAPPYAALVAALTLGWVVALAWLPRKPVERVHLVEYALLGWLAWRAASAHTRGWRPWAIALAVGTAVGWADELIQGVTPGRYYDIYDVGANAVGTALGLAATAAWLAVAGGDGDTDGRVTHGTRRRRGERPPV